MLTLTAFASASEPTPTPTPARCTVENRAADVADAVARGEAAFGAMSASDLERAEADATWLLTCMADPLTPAQVAGYLRLRGIAAFVRKDKPGALAWFDAARSADPAYVLPATLVAENHPMRALHDSAPGGPPASTTPLPAPAAGETRVNGATASEAPGGRPWVLQQLDGSGRVVLTAAIAADGPIPALVAVRGPERSDPERAPRTDGPALALIGRVGPSYQRATEDGNLLGGVGLGGTVPLAGPMLLDLGASFGITGGDGLVAVQPVLRVGARAEIGRGSTRGYVGAAGLGVLGEGGFGPGGGGLAGIRHSVGQRGLLEVDALAGWTTKPGSGGVWSMISLGLGVAL